MKTMLRTAFLGIVLTFIVGNSSTALAAIPCIDQPVLPPTLSIPPEPPERIISLEEMFTGSAISNTASAATPDARDLDPDAAGALSGPLENVVRCALYGDFAALATVVTGDYRLTHMGIGQPEAAADRIETSGNVRLLRVTSASFNGNGMVAGTAELLLDGERLLTVSVTFIEYEGNWYLSESGVLEGEDIDATIEVSLTDSSTSISNSVLSESDVVAVVIRNESEASYGYVLVPADDFSPSSIDTSREALREGRVLGYGYAGPPDDSVFAVHRLEPGMYALVLTPSDPADGVQIVLRIEVE